MVEMLGVGEGRGAPVLSPGVPLFPAHQVFTHLEALQPLPHPVLLEFIEAFSQKRDQLFNY